MSAPILELSGVGKTFVSGAERLRVLDGVDLAVRAGETLAVTGPSGSGKSTLLGVMAGLERPDSGVLRRDAWRTRVERVTGAVLVAFGAKVLAS